MAKKIIETLMEQLMAPKNNLSWLAELNLNQVVSEMKKEDGNDGDTEQLAVLAPERKCVDINFLSSYIGFKVPTIRDWVRFNKIPFLKVGKGIRFNLGEIDVWLKEKNVQIN